MCTEISCSRSLVFSGIAHLEENLDLKNPSAQTALFQNFMMNPEDVTLIPLMQSYAKVPDPKPCFSILMQALRKAYEAKGKNTEVTASWDALLENYRGIKLREVSTFDALNAEFWNKLDVRPVAIEYYEHLLNDPQATLRHIPSVNLNYFVDKLRQECDASYYTRFSQNVFE